MTDCVITSEHVFSSEPHVDKSQPLAILVQDGLIRRVCPRDEARELTREANAELMDFGDAFVCPGFHDAHQHVFHAALFPSELAAEFVGTSEADCVARMAEFAAAHPGDGWLLSHGWREALWDTPVIPTRTSLDVAFPDRPVAMYSGDAHTLWVNSAGLERLGIDRTTQPPAGGSFDRFENGELTGVIREAAGMFYVARVLADFNDEELARIYRSYFARLSAMGITSVCDMALNVIPGADGINEHIYQRLLDAGQLDVRVSMFPCLSAGGREVIQARERLDGRMLRMPAFKQFFDGVSSQHTAWCTEPYENARFVGDRGRATIDHATMRDLVMGAYATGQGTRIHTIGDAAVAAALDIFEEAQATYGPREGAYFSLEHIEDIQPEDIGRLARLGVIASVQPPHVTIDLTQPARDLGAWRAKRMWPFRELLDAGATLALGTDTPTVAPNSLDVLWCAIWRSQPLTREPVGGWYAEHAITRAEAIRAYTSGSASAAGRSDVGRLAPGQLADIAVWDHDLLTVDADEFLSSRCLATFVGGRRVH